MNKLEKRMLEILIELKEKHNIYGIKAEFEAEGSRKDELIRLQELVNKANLGTVIKLGGCEAVSDLQEAKILGVKGIVAPMIETPYAMKKYVEMVDKVYEKEEQEDLDIIFNAETITGFNNLDEILKVGQGKITNIAIGRVDFSGSLGYTRDEINSDEIYEKVKIMLEKAKENKIVTGMGGGISLAAVPFIKNLGDLLDTFETRKIIFNNNKDLNFKEALKLSTEFELLYLKNKSEGYSKMSKEDLSRIDMMTKRLEQIINL